MIVLATVVTVVLVFFTVLWIADINTDDTGDTDPGLSQGSGVVS